jgi:C4-dicarboxylate transporter, DcuC family
MFLGITILLVFIFFAALMYLNRLPALIALPLMAVIIAVLAGIPPEDIAVFVVAEGAVRLNVAIITVLFGAILSQFVSNAGIAETMVKKVAELAGDNPFVTAVAMTAVIALLFTVLGGLGSVIMVASIALPIMLSIGLPRITAGCLFLMGLGLGGIFNLTNWQLFISVLGLSQGQILRFALVIGALSALVTLSFLVFELKVRGTSFGWEEKKEDEAKKFVPWPAVLTPIVPIMLVLGFSIYNFLARPAQPFEFPIITAMLLGLVWGFITTLKKGSLNMLSKSVVDGIGSVGPAVAIIMGIGMLLNAVTDSSVISTLSPLMSRMIPSSPVPFVIFFAVLAPLSLYRGPLNLWGMGAGLVGLIVSSGVLPPFAVMAALMSVGQMQGVSDPTNTHNVWIANYLDLNVHDILKRTLPYMWMLAAVGLIAAAFMSF